MGYFWLKKRVYLGGVQPYDDGDEGRLGATTYRRTPSESWAAGQGSPANRSGPHDTAGTTCKMQQIARMRGRAAGRGRGLGEI